MKKAPNPIDKYVGSRVRIQRLMRGYSQEKLGEALGVTFQQVQKYEKGANRIGASRLQQIAKILDVPPSFFFEGSPTSGGATPPGFEEESASFVTDFVSTVEGLHLNRAFLRIEEVRVRKLLIELVVAIGDIYEGRPIQRKRAPRAKPPV